MAVFAILGYVASFVKSLKGDKDLNATTGCLDFRSIISLAQRLPINS